METYAAAVKIAILVFVALIGIEYLFSVILKKQVYRTMDTISSLSSGLTNNIKSLLKLTIVVLSYEFMYENWSLFDWRAGFGVYLLAFLGIDFASYWSHRWNHEFNLFWNRHIVHHSSEEYNLAVALRQSVSDIVAIYFFLYFPMALLGVPTEVIAITAPLHLFAQFWYHTRLIDRMGFLEKIIVTPSHHRVHHAINPIYLDKNYAAIFILWDKWFGTFQEELPTEPPVYGVTKPVATWNPLLINFMHLTQLVKDAWRAEKWWDKTRIWLMPTGWRPADVVAKYPIIYNTNPYEQVKYDTPTTPFLTVWSSFQLILHLLLQFHLISLLSELPYIDSLLYGIFCVVSVFAYTTLMDRHELTLPSEILKFLFGVSLIFYYKSWFLIDNIIPFGTLLMAIYLVFSLAVAVVYRNPQPPKS
jgi:alkylglycerol monooxygenase